MDLFMKLDGSKSSSNGSGSDMVRITDMFRKKISLEVPTVAFSGESRYLTPLWVFENGDPREQLHRSDSSQSTNSRFDLKGNTIDPHSQTKQERMKAALKLLSFREQRVLVQFWSPHVVGKHRLLTTLDQPFGLGVIDEGLCSYRRDSERNPFVVEKDNEEEDHSPPARVFRRGLPEWTSDITNYLSTDFPQQQYAFHCNLHGYLALPVFNSTTGLCVGVLELLMSSKYTSYTYEVQHVHNAMKTVDLITPQALGRPYLNVQYEHKQNLMNIIFSNLKIVCEIHKLPLAQTWAILIKQFCEIHMTAYLTTPQALHRPTLNVQNGHKQKELDIIFSTLKVVCGIHILPLAQTWAMSPLSSFASHKQCLTKSCNSFDNRCLEKVCMSTTGLPFHVQDLKMWPFWKACRERHLDKSRGYVGKALLSKGSCFCGDVTKLSDEEYPLVYNARMSRLTSCFAVFLHNVESNSDYVLEFFRVDSKCVPNVVQTLKQNFEAAYGFELGDTSAIQVVGPSTEVNNLILNTDPHSIQMFSTATTKMTHVVEMVSSDSESMVANVAKSKSAHVPNEWLSKPTQTESSTDKLVADDIIRDDINVVGERKNDNTTSYLSMSMQKPSDTISDAGKNSNRLKQGRKRKIDSLTMEAVEQHFGVPIDQAAKSLGVSRTTLQHFCREHATPTWPLPKYNKKPAHVTNLKQLQNSSLKQNLQRSSTSFYVAVLVLIRVKRWSCSSKCHGYSGRWWACGKHLYLPHKLDSIYKIAHILMQLKRWSNKTSIRHATQNRDNSAVSESTLFPKYTTNMTKVSDARNVTVKASFKDDMIKFQFLTSLGLSELENEVAQRLKLNSRMFRIKYKDEDNDMILLACDADLQNLLGFSTSNNTIKLLILMADD